LAYELTRHLQLAVFGPEALGLQAEQSSAGRDNLSAERGPAFAAESATD
jgi:hypothetical protein